MDKTTFITNVVFHLLTNVVPRWVENSGIISESDINDRLIAMAEDLWEKYTKVVGSPQLQTVTPVIGMPGPIRRQ